MKTLVETSLLGRKWVINDSEKSDNLITRILNSRGVFGDENISRFLSPTIKDSMPDPSNMIDMDVGARLMADAILSGKKIAIFGDYDVDGITSTAILIKYFRGVGADVIWHLPQRDGEGYGLNKNSVKQLYDAGAQILITVDCGISGNEETEYAKSLGMDVIITDHHSPDAEIPRADAVINPKRNDDTSGLSYLAGVGVAFLFLVALNRELKKTRDDTPNLMDLLDLVALGTICDTMQLIELNRAFVATGLRIMANEKNIGIRELMRVAGAREYSVYTVGFVIGPRLNAAGRLCSARPALELLLTDNIGTANLLANDLNEKNKERLDIQNGIMLMAEERANECKQNGKCVLFIYGENWHKGVVGIIAGRLKDKYDLPVCVATKNGDKLDGSGRSIMGVNLGYIIHQAVEAGILSEGGGHSAAAGFGMRADKIAAFEDFLEEKTLEQLGGIKPTCEVVVDMEMDAGGATLNLANEMEQLAPFGQGNPEPTMVLNGAVLGFATTMGGGGNHIRGTFRTSNGSQLTFVGFNMTDTVIGKFLLDEENINTKLRVLGKLKKNEFNGRVSAQLFLEDIAI